MTDSARRPAGGRYSEPPDAGSQAARTLIWITDLMVWDSQQILVRRPTGPARVDLPRTAGRGWGLLPARGVRPRRAAAQDSCGLASAAELLSPVSPSGWFGPRPHGPPAVASGREPAQRRALRSQSPRLQAAGFGGSWLRVGYLTDHYSYPAARRTGVGDGLCPSDALEEMP